MAVSFDVPLDRCAAYQVAVEVHRGRLIMREVAHCEEPSELLWLGRAGLCGGCALAMFPEVAERR
jgi:hypothetical protein